MNAALIDCTGGARNAVVEAHPDLCHHCGFVGDKDLQVCTECQIQAHDDCVRFREDGRCDVCYHGVEEEDARCALCCRRDPVATPHATDRLTKYLVYFGRTWSPSPDARGDETAMDLVASRLSADPSCTFRPSELPHEGQRRMSVRLEDGTVLRSDPLVVHTWCLNALFQMVTPHVLSSSVEEYWRPLLDELDAPTRQAFGVPGTAATCTFETHPCLVCREATGYLTFCAHHLSHGCQRCRMRGDARRTVKAFHPSCAVWAGMQRLVRPVHPDGMLCDGQRSLVARLCQSAPCPRDTALILSQSLPGLNLHLLHRLRDARALRASLPSERKGRRYRTWETIVRRKPTKRTWEDADVHVDRFEALLRTMLRDEDEGRQRAETIHPPVIGLFAARAAAVLRTLQGEKDGENERENEKDKGRVVEDDELFL